MSLVQDIKNILSELEPSHLEEIKSVVQHVVSDLQEGLADAEKIIAILPPGVLHLPGEVPQFISEVGAVLAVVAEALALL
jgi:hypothetical protein